MKLLLLLNWVIAMRTLLNELLDTIFSCFEKSLEVTSRLLIVFLVSLLVSSSAIARHELLCIENRWCMGSAYILCFVLLHKNNSIKFQKAPFSLGEFLSMICPKSQSSTILSCSNLKICTTVMSIPFFPTCECVITVSPSR